VSSPAVRGVAFDVGNTLWFQRADPDPGRIFEAQRRRIEPLLAAWSVRLPCPLVDVLRDVWDAVMIPYDAYDASLREVDIPRAVRGALAVRDIDLTAEQAAAWWRAGYVPVRDFWSIELYPDTVDVLRALDDVGFAIAACTNRPFTAEMFRADLEDFRIGRYIDVVVCSGDTGFVKPHPSVFELLLQRLDLPPREVLFVGDSCAVDIAGARRAGMRTAWKLNGRYDLAPCADAEFSIHDLAEVLALPPLAAAGRPSPGSPMPHEDANADRY
jgi:putative hydrolase of the HAD superfamily